MGWIIGIAIAAILGIIVVFLVFIRPATAALSALLSEDHLVDVARRMKQAKAEAFEAMGEVDTRGEGRPKGGFASSEGLLVFYTVSPDERGFLHYLSISHGGGPLAHAVGRRFVCYLAALIGIPIRSFALGISQGGRYHMKTILDPAVHEEVERREVPTPLREDVARFLADSLDEEIPFERFQVPGIRD